MQALLFVVGCVLLAGGGVFTAVAFWKGVELAVTVGFIVTGVGGATIFYFR